MTEQDTFNPALLKALFARLVRAAGRQEAAAAYLDVTHQRISQLCSATHPRDVPTWEQVFTLEQQCGRSVVFAALAEMVSPSGNGTDCALKETHELAAAAVAMCPLAAALDRSKPETVRAFADGLERVNREAADLTPIANVVPMRGAV